MPVPDFTPRWLFIDMNSYFASAEQHMRPELRGRPVGIIPIASDTSCVIAASIDAKRLGVRTGTRVPEARRLCPGIALVKARPHKYVELHHEIARCIDTCLPIHKAYSVDEWAVRLQGTERDPDRALGFAKRIKAAIRAGLSEFVPCSIGIAPTRLLAKIACELKKPDGITAIGPGDMPGALAHRTIEDLCGIGDGLAPKLRALGIDTPRALWDLTREDALHIWGSVEGERWWNAFHGVDEPEIPTRKRSVSHANVLAPEFRTEAGARKMMLRLTHRLCVRLREAERATECVRISVTGKSHEEAFARKARVPATQSTVTLIRAVYELWDPRAIRFRPLKITVMFTDLVPPEHATGSLFANLNKDLNTSLDTENRLSDAIGRINQRWGITAAYFGSIHGNTDPMDDKIAFGRVPSALLKDV